MTPLHKTTSSILVTNLDKMQTLSTLLFYSFFFMIKDKISQLLFDLNSSILETYVALAKDLTTSTTVRHAKFSNSPSSWEIQICFYIKKSQLLSSQILSNSPVYFMFKGESFCRLLRRHDW